MDPFYAFIIFAVLLVLEILAAQAWAAPYFRFGIPIFFSRIPLAEPLDETRSAQALEAQFKANPLHPTIRFKPLDSGQIALREVLFEHRAGVRYLPVMHLLVRLHSQPAQATLTGSLNWWVLAALAYLPYRALGDRSFIPVALLVLGIFVFSFFLQASMARRVALALAELPQVS